MSLSYSPLAWELAHHAKFHGEADGPPVVATLLTFTLIDVVAGRGNTTSEAMQDLARELDRYVARGGSAL